MIARSPAYPTIMSRLLQGESFLDIGCFIGHDLRRLVFDGAPSNNLYAVDILNHWELGYEFFRDADKFSAKFIETDILNPNEELKSLEGKIDIISVTHVLHQWDWDGQVLAAMKLVSFSRPGTLIVGYQAGGVAGRQPVSKSHYKVESRYTAIYPTNNIGSR
jgi:SAM-dependent methyltransferase